MTNIKGMFAIGWLCLTLVVLGIVVVAGRNNATACKTEDKSKTWMREIIMEMLSYGDSHVRKAKIIRWIDGDTVDLQIDLGYRVFIQERIRLLEVDTPEKGQPNFKKATAISRKYAPEGSKCLIRSEPAGRDKYGRWLGVIYVNGLDRTLNEILIQAGWSYKKGKK